MSAKTTGAAARDAFLEEHENLGRRLAELRKWWSELDELGMRKFGEMAFRIQELRELLAEHFAKEEQGGYLASPLATAPQFTAQAATLRAQHTDFLTRLDHLVERLRDSEAKSDYWRASREEVEQIIADLRRHEQSENAIVQAAFEDDLGTGD